MIGHRWRYFSVNYKISHSDNLDIAGELTWLRVHVWFNLDVCRVFWFGYTWLIGIDIGSESVLVGYVNNFSVNAILVPVPIATSYLLWVVALLLAPLLVSVVIFNLEMSAIYRIRWLNQTVIYIFKENESFILTECYNPTHLHHNQNCMGRSSATCVRLAHSDRLLDT